MANNQNEIGGKFTIDIDDLQKGITQANRLMKLADSEFKAAAAGMGNWADNAEGLAAKQTQLNTKMDLQQAKINALTQEYEKVAAEMGETSAQAVNLKVRINNETAAHEKNRRELENVSKALDEMERDANDAAGAANDLADAESKAAKAGDDAADSTSGFGEKAKSLASGGIKALAAAVVGLATAFFSSAEATREYRTEMGKLDAAFSSSGFNVNTASAAYEKLYSIIGETDQSVEAAQQIALLAESEKDVARWANQASGVVGKFGDALQPETFFESANETLKLNEATGAYVQMLEGTGRSVDEFNAGLAACKTEAEKQAYMLKVTEDALGAAGKAYEENNADILAANEAQNKLNESMGKVGAMAEPVSTILKTKAAEALDAFTNLFAGFNEVVSGEMSIGDFGAQVLDRIVNSITIGAPKMFNAALSILNNLSTGIQQNLPTLISQGLTMIDSLVVKIRENAPKLLQSGLAVIQNLVSGIMNSLPELIAKVPTIVSNIAGVINDNAPTILKAAVNIIMTIIKGIINAIPALVENVPKIVTAIVDVIQAFGWLNLGKSIFTFFKNGITKMGGSIKTAATGIKDKIVDAIKNLPTKLQEMASNALTKMASKLKGASGIKSAANDIAEAVMDGVKNLPSKMLDIGTDLVKGLWNGIDDMTSWIIGKIEGFGGDVLGGIKNFFGIKSPSRVMRDVVGKNLALGVADGVEQETGGAVKTVKTFSQKILDAAQMPLAGQTLISGIPGTVSTAGSANLESTPASNGTTVYFSQYNTSPKALTPYEVYRQTRIANKMILEGR